jgi:GNAT superfamily N-acetyltransferase
VSRTVEVVRTYLELRAPDRLRAAYVDDASVRFIRQIDISPADYRRLYRAVGARWHWRDRDAWSDKRLAGYLADPAISVWECLVDADTAGYFELAIRENNVVEIAYFGLVEQHIGRGLGKAMLTRACEAAFALGASRVILDTCTLDSPHALPNYKARGFEEIRKMTYAQEIPD